MEDGYSCVDLLSLYLTGFRVDIFRTIIGGFYVFMTDTSSDEILTSYKQDKSDMLDC